MPIKNQPAVAVSNKLPAVATQAAPTAPQATSESPKAPKAPKPEAAPKDAKNGITRPKADTLTGQVWVQADRISREQGRPCMRKELNEACQNLNESTVATQYGKWRRYYGLQKEPKPVKETPPTPAAQAPQAAPQEPTVVVQATE